MKDQIVEHMAVNLLPACVSFVRNLRPSDFRVKGVHGRDALNIVEIITDVAVALSAEKHGKPRFRGPAGRHAITGNVSSERPTSLAETPVSRPCRPIRRHTPPKPDGPGDAA